MYRVQDAESEIPLHGNVRKMFTEPGSVIENIQEPYLAPISGT